MKIRNPLLLSIADEGSIGGPAGGGAPSEPAAPAPQAAPAESSPGNLSELLTDVQDHFSQQPAEQPSNEAQQPDPSTEIAEPAAAAPPEAPAEPPPVAQPPEAAAPPETPPEPEAPPAPESQLAPLFDLGHLPLEEAVPIALPIIQNLMTGDAPVAEVIREAMYEANAAMYRSWALHDLGVQPERVKDFVDWAAKGAPALPQPAAPPAFPVPDADGIVRIMGANGLPLELDTTDPKDNEIYESAKFRHEAGLRDAQQRAEAEKAAETQRRQQAEYVDGAVNYSVANSGQEYVNGRVSFIDGLIAPVLAELAPEDQMMGRMFRADARQQLFDNPELTALVNKAKGYIQRVIPPLARQMASRGATVEQIQAECKKQIESGRIAQFAQEQERIIRREMNKFKDAFNKEMLRRNRAERAATVGEPVLPPGTRQVEVNTTPPPNFNEAQTLEELLANARDFDRQQAAANQQNR